MVVHSEMAKKIGIAAALFGIALVVVAGLLLIPTQDATIVIPPAYSPILFALFLGYAVTVGVYFVVIGVFVWIIGAGIEWQAQKKEEDKEEKVGQ